MANYPRTPLKPRRSLVGPVAAIALIVGLLLNFFLTLRTLGFLEWPVLLVMSIRLAHTRPSVLVVGWALYAVTLFCPFDISFLVRPSGPHFAKLLKGLPSDRAGLAAQRGEIVLGGCTVTGFEPKWVWVW